MSLIIWQITWQNKECTEQENLLLGFESAKCFWPFFCLYLFAVPSGDELFFPGFESFEF